MKKLVYIFLVLSLTTILGCNHNVDKRLVLADSLMWTKPDSSLAILTAIIRDSLPNDESRAYYALLLTQAQFRVSYDIPSDSLINSAVNYYRDNHNREHYTRALLYKGGYYEVHGNQIKAMKFYKLAETNADTTDYRNLAQINMRIGMLYYKNYASNNLDLEKFKKAQSYYERLGDKRNVLISLLNSANVYRLSDIKEANMCYDKAQVLSMELKDTVNLYIILTNRALLCLNDSLYQESKFYMSEAFALNSNNIDNCDFFIISQAYAKLGVIDSAEFFLKKADFNSLTPYDSVMLYKTLKDISISKGDFEQANKFEIVYHKLSDSLEHNKEKYSISKFESDFDNYNTTHKIKKISFLNQTIYCLIALFLIVVIVFFVYYHKKRKNFLSLISDLRNENFSKYMELRNNLADFDNHFSKTMNIKLRAFEEIMSGAYNEQEDYLSTEVAHKITPINDSDSKFWDGLFSYLNLNHAGVMDRIIKEFPQLSKADVNFIGLMCCGFSDAAIAVCKHYRNVDSVRSRRKKIRDKMGIEGSLINYVKNLTV